MFTPDDPPPNNEHVRPVVGFVVLTLAAWNLLGWMAGLGWLNPVAYLLAALTVGFELLAFNASAQMRRAADKRRHMAKKIWFVALATCSGWSIYSAHHALGVFAPMPELDVLTVDAVLGLLQAAPAVVVLTVAACLVPLLPWAIEETERAPAPVVDTAPPQPDPKITTIRQPAPARPKPKATNGFRRAVAGVGLATIGFGAPGHAVAVEKLTAGQSLRSVERETGLPYAQVRKIKAAIEAGAVGA